MKQLISVFLVLFFSVSYSYQVNAQEDEVETSAEVSTPKKKGKTKQVKKEKKLKKVGPKSKVAGVLVGLNSSSMGINYSDGSSNSFTGSSFYLGGFYDMPLGSLGLRLLGGYNMMDVKKDSYKISIGYLDIGAQGKLYLTKKGSRFWLGGGGALLAVGSKSIASGTLKSVGTSFVGLFSLGYDLVTGSHIVPIGFDYYYFPDSKADDGTTVRTVMMLFKAGYSF